MSSSSSASSRAQQLPALPPFSSSSFGLWRMQAFAVFAAHDLLDVVETDCACAAIKEERDRAGATKREQAANSAASGAAAANASAAATIAQSSASPPVSKDKDVQRSRRAYGALMMALKETQLLLVQHVPLGDAHGVWCVLLDNYDRKSVATKVQLIERFFSMEQARGERVSVYVSRVTEVAHKLAEQGEKMSDAMQLFVLLRGVTRSFPTLVTLLKMKEDLTLIDAVEAIKNEEERAKMDERRNGRGDVLLFTRAEREKEKEKSGGDRRCHECGEKGHLRHSCPKIKCHRCERNGHVAAHCKATWPAKKKKKEEEEEEEAMIVMQQQMIHDDSEEDEWSA